MEQRISWRKLKPVSILDNIPMAFWKRSVHTENIGKNTCRLRLKTSATHFLYKPSSLTHFMPLISFDAPWKGGIKEISSIKLVNDAWIQCRILHYISSLIFPDESRSVDTVAHSVTANMEVSKYTWRICLKYFDWTQQKITEIKQYKNLNKLYKYSISCLIRLFVVR